MGRLELPRPALPTHPVGAGGILVGRHIRYWEKSNFSAEHERPKVLHICTDRAADEATDTVVVPAVAPNAPFRSSAMSSRTLQIDAAHVAADRGMQQIRDEHLFPPAQTITAEFQIYQIYESAGGRIL
jgi:hypothetical protein